MKKPFFVLLMCTILATIAGVAWSWSADNESWRAAFLQAERAAADKKFDTAAEQYARVAASSWPAADLAAERARQLAESNKDDAAALGWDKFIIQHFPQSCYRPAALLSAAREHLKRNDPSPAVQWLEQLRREHPAYKESEALYSLGEAYEAAGQKKKAVAAFAEVGLWHIDNFANQANAKVAAYRSAGWTINPPPPAAMWAKILTYIEENKHYTAGVLATRFARLYPQSPDAFRAKLVYADTLIERRKHNDAKNYLKTLAKAVRTQDEQLSVSLRLLRFEKNVTSAKKRQAYMQAVKWTAKHGVHADGVMGMFNLEWDERNYQQAASWAEMALNESARFLLAPAQVRWRAGLARYLAGDYGAAAKHFQDFLREHPKHSRADAALYWQGRALLAQSKAAEAKAIFTQCEAKWRGTYYGLLAEVRLLDLGAPPSKFMTFSADMENDKVVAETIGVPVISAAWQQEGGTGPHLDKGARAAIDHYAEKGPESVRDTFRSAREMIAVDCGDEALTALDFIRERAYATADGAYFLSVAYALAGDNLRSIHAANEAYFHTLEGRMLDPDNLVLQRRFPIAYRELIFATAKKHGLDPFFVLAVIKQESAFQIAAKSWVGARGLMQVMPGTGTYIARKRKIKGFRTDSLYKPEVSVDFGCWLLADLKQKTDGDLPAMLSGYNAGYGRPLRWWPLHAGRSYDELVELIPFAETEGYVKAIMRNYEMYLRLYHDGRDHPPRASLFYGLTKPVKQFSE